jgi:hypothetical protein
MWLRWWEEGVPEVMKRAGGKGVRSNFHSSRAGEDSGDAALVCGERGRLFANHVVVLPTFAHRGVVRR